MYTLKFEINFLEFYLNRHEKNLFFYFAIGKHAIDMNLIISLKYSVKMCLHFIYYFTSRDLNIKNVHHSLAMSNIKQSPNYVVKRRHWTLRDDLEAL